MNIQIYYDKIIIIFSGGGWERADITRIQRTCLECVQNLVPPLKIGMSFKIITFWHLKESPKRYTSMH